MISVSKKNVSKLTKYGLIILIGYSLYFVSVKIIKNYKNYHEKNTLIESIIIKKNKINSLKKQKIQVEEEKIKLKQQYISKDELKKRLESIFKRMSVFDYNLTYIDAKQVCIDRYIIITQLLSESKNGRKAGEGVLSYLGKMKRSEKNDTIYYVDYISKKRIEK